MMKAHRQLVQNLIAGMPESTLIETHISSVILSGEKVYKLKKPVDFGFLDFSTLEKRKGFCEEEERINGRFAPQLGYRVVAVTGSVESPQFGGGGETIEYAVVMRRFAQEDQLDHVAARGGLDAGLIDRMAEQVADLQEKALKADLKSDFGTPARVLHPVAENFAMLDRSLFPESMWEKIENIKAWSHAKHKELVPFFEERKKSGKIRECHGDLHLHNIALIDGEVTPFDAIEFNPYFRWIDGISDLSFLLMDLEYNEQEALANRLLNRYLEITGDYGALKGLSYYKSYRAMVRVKVTALQLGQGEKEGLMDEIARYLDLALGYTEQPQPFLALMHGLSGSGKSYAALFAAGRSGGIRIRSDIERMRLFGEGVYTPEATRKTYGRLRDLASQILDAGMSVYVDAAFLKQWQREIFETLAKERGVAFCLFDCRCDEAVALERIAKRLAAQSDVSEADKEVYAYQKKGMEPFEPGERRYVVAVDCNDETSMQGDVTAWLETNGSRACGS